MKRLHEFLSMNKEQSGICRMSYDGFKYTLDIDKKTIVEGHNHSFKVNLHAPMPKTHQVSFHTHPNLCYKKLACALGPPSMADYNVAFQRIVAGEAAHMVVTLEGIYVVRMYEKSLLFFRGLLEHFRNPGQGIMEMQTCIASLVQNTMAELENARFGKFHGVTRTGQNQTIKYTTPNGTTHNTANFALRNYGPNNMRRLQEYSKQLYKDTVRTIKTIRIKDFVDNFRVSNTTWKQNSVSKINPYLESFGDSMNQPIFHVRLYHRKTDNPGLVTPISDYTKSISFSLIVDHASIQRKRRSPAAREEFTTPQRTPVSFTRNNTSPYTTAHAGPSRPRRAQPRRQIRPGPPRRTAAASRQNMNAGPSTYGPRKKQRRNSNR